MAAPASRRQPRQQASRRLRRPPHAPTSHAPLDRTQRLLRLSLLLLSALIAALYLSNLQSSDIGAAMEARAAERKRADMEKEWARAANVEMRGQVRQRGHLSGDFGGGAPDGGRERIMGLHPGQMRPSERLSSASGRAAPPGRAAPSSPAVPAAPAPGAEASSAKGDGETKEEGGDELTDAALDEQEREFGVRHKRTKEAMPHAAMDHDVGDDEEIRDEGNGNGNDSRKENSGREDSPGNVLRSGNRTSHAKRVKAPHAAPAARRNGTGTGADGTAEDAAGDDKDAERPVRNPRNLFWLHIQKTGTSLFNALYLHFCPRILQSHPDLATQSEPLIEYDLVKGYPPKEYCSPDGVKFYNMPTVGFHHPYEARRMSRDGSGEWEDFDSFAMFRDPLERLRSAYSFREHSAKRVPHYSKLDDPDITLAQYLGEEHIPNCQIKMLLGHRCHAFVPPAELNQTLAVERISAPNFYFGLTDRWDESLCLFHRAYGGTVRKYELTNNRPSKRVATGGDAPKGWKDLDTAFVEKATAIFEARLERAGCRGYEYAGKMKRRGNATHAVE